MTGEELFAKVKAKYFPDPEPETFDLAEVLTRFGADPSKADPIATGYDSYAARLGFPEDWRELAKHLRGKKRTYEYIALFCRLIYSPRHPTKSEVERVLDPKAAEKHRADCRRYWSRVQEQPDKHEARKKAMRAYYYANREGILNQQAGYRSNRP